MKTMLWLLLAVAACGGKPGGEVCVLEKPAECASGGCVTVTCPSMVDKTICSSGLCNDKPCAAAEDCIEFASGRKHCVPQKVCR